jgi:hypothetical protein
MLAILNHPNFGWGIRAEDIILAEELRFFEVFNGHPGVRNYGDSVHPGCERMWDIALALRLGKYHLPVIYGVATDDAHNYHSYSVGKANPGRSWIMARAPYLTAEAILQAMNAGDFYPTSGVTLTDIRRTNNQVKLTIAGQPGIIYKTQFIATLRDTPLDSQPRMVDGKPLDVSRVYHDDIGKVVAESNSLTPSYTFTGDELYVRARITSSRPHPNPFQKGDVEMAWTQPFLPESPSE